MAYTVTNNPWSSQYSVGIGIDDPTRELDVKGDQPSIRLQNSGTAGNDETNLEYVDLHGQIHTQIGLQLKDDSDGGTYDSAFHIRTAVNGALATRFAIKDDGLVGIGTTNPDTLLDIMTADSSVSPSTSADELMIENSAICGMTIASGTSSSGNIFFGDSGDAAVGQISYNHNGNYMLFATGGTERVRILSGGNFGIGTTAPTSKLSVVSASLGSVTMLEGAVGGAPSGDTGMLNVTTNVGGGKWATQMRADHSTANGLFIRAGSGTSYYTAYLTGYDENNVHMVVRGDGNVGIGTSAPASELHIQGTGAQELRIESDDQDALIVLDWDGADNGLIIFKESGTEKGRIYMDGTNEDMHFKTAGTDRLVIEDGGNVGIGASSPSYKLEVAGTFYSAGSSATYKENIEDLEVDSSLIHSLRAVSYDYKKEYKDFGYNVKDGKQMGLISEEVAETIPELAIMKDGRPKNVDYQKLAVVLLAEVQNLKKDIEELKEI